MKKILTFIIVLTNTTLSAMASADTTTYAGIKLEGEAGTTAVAAELLVRLHDNIEVGARYQDTYTTPIVFVSDPSNSGKPEMAGDKSYSYIKNYTSECLTGNYYFNAYDKSVAKFFAGGGLGLYNEYYSLTTYTVITPLSSGSLGKSSSSTNTTITNHLGGFFRIGMDLWHFRLSMDYDVTGLGYAYGSANIGFFLGGGKK